MSYSDFLNTLAYAFTLFINTLTAWVNNLMSNYFFITILGIGLFVSFIIFILDNFIVITLFGHSSSEDKDNQYN